MPSLKHLTCAIKWAGSTKALDEFGTSYGDGRVETYIAVPDHPTAFFIQLTSDGYIAPGIAMFVYMDGEYQCNRNRRNLKFPDGKTPRRYTEVNLKVRQKETMLKTGIMYGQQWRFEKLNQAANQSQNTSRQAPFGGEYVGIIEVVVLRCAPDDAGDPKETETKRTTEHSSAYLLDGASDSLQYRILGLDGEFEERTLEPHQDSNQNWGVTMTSANTGTYGPKPASAIGSSHSRGHFNSDWVDSNDPTSPKVVINITNGPVGSHTSRRPSNQPQLEDEDWHSNMGNTAGKKRNSPPRNHDTGQPERGRIKEPVESPPRENSGGAVDWATDWATEHYDDGTNLPGQQECSNHNETYNADKNDDPWNNTCSNCGLDQGSQGVSDREQNICQASWEQNVNQSDQGASHRWSSDQTKPVYDNILDSNHNANQPYEPQKTDNAMGNRIGHSGLDKEDHISHQGGNHGDSSRNTGGTYGQFRQNTEGAYHSHERPWDKTKNDTGNDSHEFAPGHMLTDWGLNHSPMLQRQTPPSHVTTGPTTPMQRPVAWGSPHGKANFNATPMHTLQRHTDGAVIEPSAPPPSWSQPQAASSGRSRAWSGRSQVPLPMPVQRKEAQIVVPPERPDSSKQYWSAWRDSAHYGSVEPPKVFDPQEPEKPLYSVPDEIVQRNNTSHQIQIGKAAAYAHKLATPKYMDTFEVPYAVFIFKYRERAALERILNMTINESPEDEKERLRGMSKEEIIEELVSEKRVRSSNAVPSGPIGIGIELGEADERLPSFNVKSSQHPTALVPDQQGVGEGARYSSGPPQQNDSGSSNNDPLRTLPPENNGVWSKREWQGHRNTNGPASSTQQHPGRGNARGGDEWADNDNGGEANGHARIGGNNNHSQANNSAWVPPNETSGDGGGW